MFVCCQVEVSATSWSLVQRTPTDCGASLCVISLAAVLYCVEVCSVAASCNGVVFLCLCWFCVVAFCWFVLSVDPQCDSFSEPPKPCPLTARHHLPFRWTPRPTRYNICTHTRVKSLSCVNFVLTDRARERGTVIECNLMFVSAVSSISFDVLYTSSL
jgi:hypothetical protein